MRARPDERRAAAGQAATRAARLGLGVAVALMGLGVTGGSFGLFAAIGIPIMAVGLSLISAEVNRDGAAGSRPTAIVVSLEPQQDPQRLQTREAATTETSRAA